MRRHRDKGKRSQRKPGKQTMGVNRMTYISITASALFMAVFFVAHALAF